MQRRRSLIIMKSETVDHCCIETDEYWKQKFGPCFCIWRLYVRLFDLCKKSSLIDSPPAILIIQSKEALEIALQTIAFYFYGGSQSDFIKFVNSGNVDIDSTVILAENIKYVELFAHVLSVDCIIISILWCLYIFQHEIFRASFFRYLLFSIDFTFDMFYATFPLFLIGQSNLGFMTAAAKVNSESMVIFVATLFPIMYVTLKLFFILNVLSNHAATQFNISFRLKGLGLSKAEPTDVPKNETKANKAAKTGTEDKVITARHIPTASTTLDLSISPNNQAENSTTLTLTHQIHQIHLIHQTYKLHKTNNCKQNYKSNKKNSKKNKMRHHQWVK